MSDELNPLLYGAGATNEAVTYRALFQLHSQMAQALTEYVDEEARIPNASWQVVAVEAQTLGNLYEKFPSGAVWGVLDFRDQPGGAFLLLTAQAARSLVGLGGQGELMDNEFAMVDFHLGMVGEAFSQAWTDIAQLDPQLGTFPEAPTLADLQEIFMGLTLHTPLITTTFRVTVPGRPVERILLAIPEPYLIPLSSSMAAAAELTVSNADTEEMPQRLAHLADVPVPFAVHLGTTSMTVNELQNLEEEDVILLDQAVAEPLVAVAGSGAKLLVRPGTTPDGARKAVEIVGLVGDG